MKRAFLAAIALAFAVNTVSVEAEAVPPPPPSAVETEALIGVVAAQLDHFAHFIQAMKTVISNHPNAVDQAGKDSFKAARDSWEKAKAKHKAGEHKQAYRLVHKTTHDMRPAVDQVMGKGHVPPELAEALAKQLQITAERIDRIAPHVANNATPEGKAAYGEGKELHKKAAAAWKNGARLDAWKLEWKAIRQLDKAIRSTWDIPV